MRRVIASELVVLLVAALAWGTWWWRHPSVFEEAGIGIGNGEKLPAQSLPRHFDLFVNAESRNGSVTLLDAEPHIAVNSADAEISFHVCVAKPPNDFFVGARGDLSRWCSEVSEVEDAVLPLSLDRPRHLLVMTIESAEPGELRIDGFDLTYRNGLQTGTQRVGPDVWFRVI